jgi:hypothetical protein
MTHTWKLLCVATLGAAFLVGPRLQAAGTDELKAQPPKACVAALGAAYLVGPLLQTASTDEPRPQPTNADIKALLEKLNDKLGYLENGLHDMKVQRGRADARTQGIEEQLRILGDRVEQMERRIERMPATTRQSFFQPTPVNPAPALGAGTIMLQNTWSDAATVTINDRSVVVPPYQTVTLPNQATGTYTYEVLVNGYGRIRGPVSRFLDNNDRMIISVFPIPAIR